MLRCVLQKGCRMSKKTIKSNIQKTLFFASSIILSTLFLIIFLVTKTECLSLTEDLQILNQKKNKYLTKIKSLNRKKAILIESIEQIAAENYNYTTPDPQPVIVSIKRDL